MRKYPDLDDAAVERLMRGLATPDEALPPYRRLAALLHQASGSRIDPAVVPLAAHRRDSMLTRMMTAKAASIAVGVLALTAASAAAATGNLPDAAQDGLAKAASHVGIDLPASHDNHPTRDSHPGGSPASTTEPSDSDAADHGAADHGAADHGAEVSDAARDDSTTGREKGATVSEIARDGHGQSPPSSTPPVSLPPAAQGAPTTPAAGAPVETPNPGGTGTSDDASDGASEVGTGHAPPAADAGSDNAVTPSTGRP